MWQTLLSKEIFKHPRITLVENEVVLPSGKETTYLTFADELNSAVIIFRDGEGKILIQKEYAFPLGKELLQFPGGGVYADEPIEVGANRELMEESKIYANTLVLLGSYLSNYRRSAARVHVFLGTDLEERSLPEDPDEFIENGWYTEAEIDELIRKGEVIQPHLLAPWMLYKLRQPS